MTLSISETALLDQALLAFNRETGLSFNKQEVSELFPDAADTSLELRPHGIEYSVELKRWMQQANVGAILAQLQRMPAPALLVADYVNPNMADRLRDAGMQFIDAAGNAYLYEKNLYIFIKGNRLPSEYSSPRKTTRAFNASGLKVIFSFLLEPRLVGETYRTIAETSDVSLGTIGWVLNDLKDRGYVQEHGKGRSRSLKTPLELFDRWVEAYPEKLLPELDMGFFQTRFQLPWKDIEPTGFGGCWGGEVGASILDDYLSPAQGLIYVPKSSFKDLLINYRLRKADRDRTTTSDTIRVYEKFWHSFPETIDTNTKHQVAAPDILIYADLLASGDPRNLEAAERLYDRIKTRLRVD
ncbi:type IV toxin-antitoxin system AbiEi family antitoxin [Marinobacter sp. GN3S48]|uniref:type IV toxin-antitoxin system AbiEi family antitoxin n=1 Tax=Marinobacter sp. GN3S48 TaxID=3382302 RepID=UPI00387ACA56